MVATWLTVYRLKCLMSTIFQHFILSSLCFLTLSNIGHRCHRCWKVFICVCLAVCLSGLAVTPVNVLGLPRAWYMLFKFTVGHSLLEVNCVASIVLRLYEHTKYFPYIMVYRGKLFTVHFRKLHSSEMQYNILLV